LSLLVMCCTHSVVPKLRRARCAATRLCAGTRTRIDSGSGTGSGTGTGTGTGTRNRCSQRAIASWRPHALAGCVGTT
jgi:hypothetical protein